MVFCLKKLKNASGAHPLFGLVTRKYVTKLMTAYKDVARVKLKTHKSSNVSLFQKFEKVSFNEKSESCLKSHSQLQLMSLIWYALMRQNV